MIDTGENIFSYCGLTAMFIAFVLARTIRVPEYVQMFIVSAGMALGAIGRLVVLWERPHVLPVFLFMYVMLALIFLAWGYDTMPKQARRRSTAAVPDAAVVPDWRNHIEPDDDRFKHG